MAKLYFRYGAMNCGKSTHLLQVAHNYEERGMKTIVTKPAIDTKGGNTIVSRLGASREVDFLIKENDNLMDKFLSLEQEIDCILIEEAQFLTPRQVNELYRVAKIRDLPIICFGLRCDFQMHGFPGATRLLEVADSIEELKTICKCGKKATQNLRLINNKPVFEGNQICIDNQNSISYEAVCGNCYLETINQLFTIN